MIVVQTWILWMSMPLFGYMAGLALRRLQKRGAYARGLFSFVAAGVLAGLGELAQYLPTPTALIGGGAMDLLAVLLVAAGASGALSALALQLVTRFGAVTPSITTLIIVGVVAGYVGYELALSIQLHSLSWEVDIWWTSRIPLFAIAMAAAVRRNCCKPIVKSRQ